MILWARASIGRLRDFARRKLFGYDRMFQVRRLGTEYRPPIRIDNRHGFVLGKSVYIGPHCHFDALGGIEVDDYAIIGPHVKIWSYNHDFKSSMIPYGPELIKRSVSIGRGAWIGVGAIILPGSNIGEGCIIGGGAIVRGVIPPFSMVTTDAPKIQKLDVEKDRTSFYRVWKTTRKIPND